MRGRTRWVWDGAVWRLLRTEGIPQPPVVCQYRPGVRRLAADIIGLDWNLPQNERPSHQRGRETLDPGAGHSRGYEARSAKVVLRLKCLQATPDRQPDRRMEGATGLIRNETTATKKRADFQAFLDEVVADRPADRHPDHPPRQGGPLRLAPARGAGIAAAQYHSSFTQFSTSRRGGRVY